MLKIVRELLSEEGYIWLHTKMSLGARKTKRHELTDLHYTNRYILFFITLFLPVLLTSLLRFFLLSSLAGFLGYLMCLRARSAEWDVMFHDILLDFGPWYTLSALDACSGRE